MIAKFPKEIEEKLKICWPYAKEIYKGELQNVPEEAIKAYEDFKAWSWEHGQ